MTEKLTDASPMSIIYESAEIRSAFHKCLLLRAEL